MIEKKSDMMFWLSIMRDHAIFQISTLAPKEKMYIEKAMEFKDFFQNMMDKLKDNKKCTQKTPEILNTLNEFILFKRTILRGLLTCELEINLPPTLINHQINEAVEFQYALMLPENYYDNFNSPMIFMNFLKSWISDSSGHAAAYASFLDPTEGMLRNEALLFKNSFDMLVIKSDELQIMMMRSGVTNGNFDYLLEEVSNLMKSFIMYLEKILNLRCKCGAMAIGTLTPLLPDHMIREHKYYLNKIEEYVKSRA